MFKKMLMLAVSATALVAFAVPASASAEPLVHDEAWNAVEEFTAVGDGLAMSHLAGFTECEGAELNITLTENTETTAHGYGIGEGYGEDPAKPCKTTAYRTGTVFIDPIVVNSLSLEGGAGAMAFELDYGDLCTLTGTATFTYTPGSNELINPSGTVTGTGSLCQYFSGSIWFNSLVLQGGVTIGY